MLVFSHEAAAGHVTPPGHPERVERLGAVERGLARFVGERRLSALADDADILRCHPAGYLARVKGAEPVVGFAQLDPDTWMSAGSFEAASRAVGGACAAVDAVLSPSDNSGGRAFVVARPPGHHAERALSMGFCLFGTVAIAAKRALEVHGLRRVAVVDFDVHHGNGTQDLLWDEARVRFVSSQQMPLWPGTGETAERGAHGQIMNVPLAPGSDGGVMRAVYDAAVFPWLEAFEPELVLVSAGFDAHADDPLAALRWQAEDYGWLTQRLCGLADRWAKGRVVSCLEGGYDLGALEASVAAHVGALQEQA